MKIALKKTSPSIRSNNSTLKIMNELTLALLVVCVFALAYNFNLGVNYGIHALLIMVISCVTAVSVEVIWAYHHGVEDINKAVINSFPFVTAIIYALTLPVGTPYYVVAVGALIAILFGKLVYGGFGQNVFNPALVGRVVVHLSFGAKLVTTLGADVVTAATPLTQMASNNWVVASETGIVTMFTGLYGGAIGETCTLLILVLGYFLAKREVIDYRITVSYLGTAALLAFIQGIICGLNPFTNALAHIALGGIAFAAVFMATDPVTGPSAPLGKIIYGIALGFITMLVRLKANFPEGALFSILIMNMFAPMIDNFTLGRTNKELDKKWAIIGGALVIAVASIAGLSTNLEAPVKEEPAPVVEAEPEALEVSVDGNVYTVKAKGFQPMTVAVTLDGTTATVEVVEHNETAGFGADLITAGNGGSLNEKAQAFYDAVIATSFDVSSLEGIDTATGATLTTKGIINAVNAAVDCMNNGGVSTAPAGPAISVDGNVYTVEAQGFGAMKVAVTIEGTTVTKVEVVEHTETPYYGADLIEYGSGGNLKPTSQAFYDTVLANPFEASALDGVDTATGATLTANGIVQAVKDAVAESQK